MLNIYELCKQLSKDEMYITADQIKRSSFSVPANISEGYGRSLYETRNHLIIRHLMNSKLGANDE